MILLPVESTLFPYTALFFFFFNDTATTEIYTLSLHDALPISPSRWRSVVRTARSPTRARPPAPHPRTARSARPLPGRPTAQCSYRLLLSLLCGLEWAIEQFAPRDR